MIVQIFDLDNCISDDSERIHLIDMSLDGDYRYAKYHKDCHKDKAKNLKFINKDCKTAIFTARPEYLRGKTLVWLKKVAKIDVFALYMRPINSPHSKLKSPQLKKIFLEQLMTKHDLVVKNIVCAYDDRLDVVAMYREMEVESKALAIRKQFITRERDSK